MRSLLDPRLAPRLLPALIPGLASGLLVVIRPSAGSAAPPAARASASRSWVLAGKALLPGGQPAAGARVWVGWDSGPLQGDFVEGRAGDGGDFKVTLRADHLDRVSVGAQAPGTAPTWRVISLPTRSAPAPVTLKLAAPVTLTARLLRATGSPAPGVRLDLTELRPAVDSPVAHLVPAGIIQRLGTRTGRDGRFKLSGLPPHCDVSLSLGDDLMPAAGSPLRFRLGRAGVQEAGLLVAVKPGSIQATVQDAGGKPALGPPGRLRRAAPVAADTASDVLFGGLRAQYAAQVAPVEIEPNGLARVDNLPPGRYELAIRGRSYPVEVAEGGVAGPLKVVTRGEPLSGTVLDPGGKPVRARVEVWVGRERTSWPPGPGQPSLCGGDGVFEVLDFPWSAPEVTIRAVAGNDEAIWRGDPARLHMPFTLNLRRDLLVTVRGRLLGPDGKALGGTSVAVFAREGGRPQALAIGPADPGGGFNIPGVPRKRRVAVGVVQSGVALESRFEETPAAGEALDLGPVRLAPSPSALATAADQAAALAPAAIPTEADLREARDTAWKFLQAVRSAEIGAIRALTSSLTPASGSGPEHLLQDLPLRIPDGSPSGSRESLQPLAVLPRLTLLSLFAPDEERESFLRAISLFDRPEWTAVGYRSGSAVRILAVLHREADGRSQGWRVVGGLQSDPNGAAITGDTALFGVPYATPPAGPVLLAARSYLASWARGADAELWKRASPHAVEYAPDMDAFRRNWRARPDHGAAPAGLGESVPELDTRFSRWDTLLLLAYPRLLAQVRSGQQARMPGGGGFPHSDVLAGNVAVVRYRAGGVPYLMLLHRRDGRWEVVEPALHV